MLRMQKKEKKNMGIKRRGSEKERESKRERERENTLLPGKRSGLGEPAQCSIMWPNFLPHHRQTGSAIWPPVPKKHPYLIHFICNESNNNRRAVLSDVAATCRCACRESNKNFCTTSEKWKTFSRNANELGACRMSNLCTCKQFTWTQRQK